MSTPILKKIHSLCLCLLFIQPIFALSNKSSHNLLIINSYNEQAAWSNSIIVPIMQEVGKMSNTSAYIIRKTTRTIFQNETVRFSSDCQNEMVRFELKFNSIETVFDYRFNAIKF